MRYGFWYLACQILKIQQLAHLISMLLEVLKNTKMLFSITNNQKKKKNATSGVLNLKKIANLILGVKSVQVSQC